MDMNLFRKTLANQSPKKALFESLPKHKITGTVQDVRVSRLPLQGYRARVFLNPVTATSGISLDTCIVDVDLGQNPNAIQKGAKWAFDVEENPLASIPHWPAFAAYKARRV